jgi:ribose 5-phosphate isomerase B
MKIYIGADHGGFHLRQQLIAYLQKNNHDVDDEGDTVLDPGDDYPEFAAKVAAKVLSSKDDDPRGILVCKGAQGMGMAANRYKGIRASVVWDTNEARMTRNDNDSNILCLSARLFEDDFSRVRAIVDIWLETPFSKAVRHQRRVRQLDELG